MPEPINEEMNNQEIVTEVEGSEIFDGEPEVELPDGDIEPGPGEEYEQPETEETTPTPILGKFKTQDDLVKSYTELERDNTETKQRLSFFEKMLQERIESQHHQQPVAKPEPEPEIPNFTEEEYARYIENPAKFIQEQTRKNFKEWHRQALEDSANVESYSDKAQRQAHERLLAREPKFAKPPKAVQEELDKILAEPSMANVFNNVISTDNYRNTSPESAIANYEVLYQVAYERAYGKAAMRAVRNAKVEAMREAKKSYGNKAKAAGSLKSGAATKPTQASPVKQSGQEYLKRLADL